MGVWGEGNFENDDALNRVGVLLQSIIKDIREYFTKNTTPRELISNGDAHIIANIDIIHALCIYCQTFPDLEVDEVNKWYTTYLDAFDECLDVKNIVDINDPIFKRRAIVVSTFYQLEKLVNEFWVED